MIACAAVVLLGGTLVLTGVIGGPRAPAVMRWDADARTTVPADFGFLVFPREASGAKLIDSAGGATLVQHALLITNRNFSQQSWHLTLGQSKVTATPHDWTLAAPDDYVERIAALSALEHPGPPPLGSDGRRLHSRAIQAWAELYAHGSDRVSVLRWVGAPGSSTELRIRHVYNVYRAVPSGSARGLPRGSAGVTPAFDPTVKVQPLELQIRPANEGSEQERVGPRNTSASRPDPDAARLPAPLQQPAVSPAVTPAADSGDDQSSPVSGATILLGVAGALALGALAGALLTRAYLRRSARQRQHEDLRARQNERLAELGSMTGGLAHEIKNPLSTLGLNAQLIAEAVDELPDDQPVKARLRSRTGALRRESERLRGILQDFLDYAGNVRLDKRPLDIREVLIEMVDFLTPEAQRAGVRLRLDAPEQPLVVLADERLLKQALLNLLLNAVQAVGGPVPMHPQGTATQPAPSKGEVILRARPQPVSAQSARGQSARGQSARAQASRVQSARAQSKLGNLPSGTNPGVIIDVIDTGPGIAPDNIDKVFRPYFTTKAGGTGLGLPTTRRYIEEHGGTIALQSTPGLGTQFSITLPAE